MKGVIQVGAHYCEEFEKWKAEGVENFLLFEPIKDNYDKMVKILPKSENIITKNMALGNCQGQINMYVETEHNGKSCSVLEPKYHLEQYPDIEFTKNEVVNIDRLDSIDYQRSLYDHLNIDTQGYELEVLKGAVNSLYAIKTIEVEVYRKELYAGCPMFVDIENFLRCFDFWIERVSWVGLTWGNAFFRKYKL